MIEKFISLCKKIEILFSYNQNASETTLQVCPEQMSCDTTTDCPICMEVVHSTVNCVITECGHTFHTRCLLTNIVHNGFGCPYCRTEMVPEELLQGDDEEDDEMDESFIEEDEDEEGREEDRHNWLTAPLNDGGVTIRRGQMNRLMMYERSHSTMRLMFARLEDDAEAEPEDVDFEDYSTIASDNYSFDEEDFTESESDSDAESETDSEYVGGVVDEVAEEAARAMANHLPSVSHITYSLERAEYGVDDFVRILLHNEYPQYSSIIESRRAQSTHRTVTRLIGRLISRFQERIHHPTSQDNTIETSISELNDRQTSIEQNIEQLRTMIRQVRDPEPQDDENEEYADDEPVVWDETQIRTHAQVGIDLD